MEDLIYSFLLQSDYPRASVIFDMDLLGPVAQPAAGLKTPSFIIVDPDTAAILAVMEVVDAIDGDSLRQVAIETGAYASRLAGKSIQGFVIRVDVRGQTESEQVQFYRIWPNSTLQRLSSKTFPDLETLKVARLLADGPATDAASSQVPTGELPAEADVAQRPEPGIYLPAVVLLLLILLDGYLSQTRGTSLLTVSRSVLAFGAAMLFTVPAALRYLRR